MNEQIASLDKNVFYHTLMTVYKRRYSEATEKCWIICVPINECIDSNAINEKFVSAHILKPSPLLKSHYIPSNHRHNFDVEIEGTVITITRGSDREYISIVGEETAYNYKNENYRILIIECPFIRLNNRKNNLSFRTAKSESSLTSFEECKTFLNGLSSDFTAIIETKINRLMSTYVILPNYIQHASDKIKAVIDWGIEEFKRVCSKPECDHPEFDFAVESLIIGSIYDKLFPAVLKRYSNDDEYLYEKLTLLTNLNINPVEFGAQKVLCNFKTNSDIIAEMSNLEKRITPLEKLSCLKKTLDLVNAQMIKTIEESSSPLFGKSQTICIMSDDLIPTVICVLSAARLRHFASEIQFIQTFNWNLPRNNELGYSLVTFEVAKEYIRNFDIKELNRKSDTSECSSKANLKVNTESDCEANFDATDLGSSPLGLSPLSPLDRELEKIAKMIEPVKRNHDTANGGNHRLENEDLGEFLGSLSQNNFSVGFGKQF